MTEVKIEKKIQSFEDIIEDVTDHDNICYRATIVNALRDRFKSVCEVQAAMEFLNQDHILVSVEIAPAVKILCSFDDKLDHLVINVFGLMFDSIYRDEIPYYVQKVLNSFSDYQATGKFAE